MAVCLNGLEYWPLYSCMNGHSFYSFFKEWCFATLTWPITKRGGGEYFLCTSCPWLNIKVRLTILLSLPCAVQSRQWHLGSFYLSHPSRGCLCCLGSASAEDCPETCVLLVAAPCTHPHWAQNCRIRPKLEYTRDIQVSVLLDFRWKRWGWEE